MLRNVITLTLSSVFHSIRIRFCDVKKLPQSPVPELNKLQHGWQQTRKWKTVVESVQNIFTLQT